MDQVKIIQTDKNSNELDVLAQLHKTDKWGKHHYTPVYYGLFEDRRESVKKVVEVGIAEGASLAMWNDFFPNAKIYGADIDTDRVTLPLIYPRITTIKCDQSSYDDLFDLIGHTGSDIDLFIDDGSHKPEDQVFTCLTVMQWLQEGAIYVIEDVADESIYEYFGDYARDIQKLSKRYDDRLIILKK